MIVLKLDTLESSNTIGEKELPPVAHISIWFFWSCSLFTSVNCPSHCICQDDSLSFLPSALLAPVSKRRQAAAAAAEPARNCEEEPAHRPQPQKKKICV